MKDPDVTSQPTPSADSANEPTKRRSADIDQADATHADLVASALDVDIDQARSILGSLGGLSSFAYATETELVEAGVHHRKARRLRDALELARVSIAGRPVRGRRLAGASEVWTHMRARLSNAPVEEFWAIALDVRHRVLFDEMLARGSLTGVEIHPRDVFRPLIKAGAAAVLFTHNHPSGDPSPSRADIELTARLREVGDLCGIAVLDHVVVGSEGFVSLAERNWR